MEDLFRSSPIARDRIERGQMAISARNASHKEELERYKNTLDQQRRREKSFLLFQRKKFVSRQEKILGKSFQTCTSQRESKRSELPRAMENRIVKERKMSHDSTSINKISKAEVKKTQSRRSSSACGKINRQIKEKPKENDVSTKSKITENLEVEKSRKFSKESVNRSEEIVKIKSLEISTKEKLDIKERQVKQDNFFSSENTDEKVTESFLFRESFPVVQKDTIENRRQIERLRTSRISLSLPEIICPSKLNAEDFAETSDLSNKDCKLTKKLKKSKKNRGPKKHPTKKRTPRSLVKSSSLPDVRASTSEKTCESKTKKCAEKSKRETGLTLPRVTQKHTDAKPKKTEASVNLSVVCRVIRIKNHLTKRKRSRKERDKLFVRKEEELRSPEDWESLKNCRYLRITNTDTREAVLT